MFPSQAQTPTSQLLSITDSGTLFPISINHFTLSTFTTSEFVDMVSLSACVFSDSSSLMAMKSQGRTLPSAGTLRSKLHAKDQLCHNISQSLSSMPSTSLFQPLPSTLLRNRLQRSSYLLLLHQSHPRKLPENIAGSNDSLQF